MSFAVETNSGDDVCSMLWDDEEHTVVNDGGPISPSNLDALAQPSPLVKSPVTCRMFNAQSVFLSIKAEPAFSDD